MMKYLIHLCRTSVNKLNLDFEIYTENFHVTVFEVVYPEMARKCEYDPVNHEYKFRRNLLTQFNVSIDSTVSSGDDEYPKGEKFILAEVLEKIRDDAKKFSWEFKKPVKFVL